MTIRNAFWLLTLGLVCMYAFLAALGAFDPTETVGASVAVIVLAVLWGVHAALEHRHLHDIQRDPSIRAARERRGF